MLDPVWCAEFSGFFWGEGNFMIDLHVRTIPSKRKLKDGSIRHYGTVDVFTVGVRARITQRADSRAVLEHIQSKLGGNIYTHKGRSMVSGANGNTYTNHKQFVWHVSKRDTVEQILDILDGSQFPTLKRREIVLIREVINIMNSRVYGYTEEAKTRLYELKQELTNLRKFSG